ncbi:MAG: glycosyltransferase family 2 protein [Gemmatimonadales bacterium]|nr:MAG: glycosyltransferase family 2 protein [Gemmatimonadales bacterium]
MLWMACGGAEGPPPDPPPRPLLVRVGSKAAMHSPRPDPGDVVVLVPARDEAANLPPLLASLQSAGIREVVVVDNGSRDDTARVAAGAGARVVTEPRPGYGRACLAGLATLDHLEPTPEVVVFMDADGSDDPALLSRLAGPCLEGRAEMVVGVRLPTEEGRREPGKERARQGTRWVLALARLLHGLRSRDLGPFRAIRTDALGCLAMDDPTWGWTLQMQLRAHHLGLRVLEVEVPARPRRSGTSKVSGSLVMSVRVGVRMLWTLLRERVRAARLRKPSAPSRP